VCAARIGAERATEVERAIRWARGQGLHVLFLTSTVRHGRGDPLEDLRRQLSGAWRRLRQKRAWREGVGSIVVHSIKATEVTYGQNGWHPHAHSLLFVRASSGEAARRAVVAAGALWVEAVKAAGGHSVAGPGWDVRLVDGEAEDGRVSRYLAKWGADKSAAFELTLRDAKAGGVGLSWLQLLRCAAAGDGEAVLRFAEYERAMAGVQALVWSDGLRDLVALLPVSDDELGARPEPMRVEAVVCIPRAAWSVLLARGVTGDLLQCSRAGPVAAEAFLREHFGDLAGAGILLELGEPF
jgi:hypothetical protein